MKVLKSHVTLKDTMHFMGELDGHDIPIDAAEVFGGQNKGPKPKGLLLTALTGCTAMDVISILRKKRSEPEYFDVAAEGELTDHHPMVFKSILVTYTFKGENITEEKAARAIEMSLDNYCGVAAMLRKHCPIDYKIVIQ